MPLRLIDSSIWISYLRPQPAARLVAAVHEALKAGEAAVATPIVAEVLAGIRDASEYAARQTDFRALPHVATDGEVGYTAARIGRALAGAGKTSKTVDLILAAASIHSGAELWSLPDEHYEDIRAFLKTRELRDVSPLRVRWLP